MSLGEKQIHRGIGETGQYIKCMAMEIKKKEKNCNPKFHVDISMALLHRILISEA